ncbi:mycofactocin system GMC family oxidoreductase MftG [Gordonia sp. HY285]|uniref:mycofactocin system GMC family oxidoreductase MftG n=1 Tax=Gordonia liuliyuniae TaxID=2911517 RepID=UPI001F1DA203|nr:mycofactocin system GMC family oxidoreductase MftG [Gordonia liuliyuniae]MCF8609795.1 mycofactocin system GMC family oxidoreductase MftG [Gordonia liuliyuniae]
MSPHPASADVVIVGAGSAGCVLAERLSRDPSRAVTVLERGPRGPFAAPLDRLPIDSPDRATPIVERGGRPVVRGSGVGGSSAINGAYFLRGHRDDYRSWPWSGDEVDSAFDAAAASMRATPFADDELGVLARTFEAACGGPVNTGPWPSDGLNRVWSNRVDGARWTAGHVLSAAAGRPGLTIRPGVDVVALETSGDEVVGVRVATGELIEAGEVIVCAGTLGTARLVAPLVGPLPVHEHAERIVRFTPRTALRAPALLQTVLHVDGLEIRAYGDDFAAFTSLEPTGAPIGVADMAGTSGVVDGESIDLGVPDAASSERMSRGVRRVVDMLEGRTFADLVEPGSVRVDPVIGLSQHAWGSLPAGEATDADGRVQGWRGLRVVDGSILPGPLHSGPHASIVMLAVLLAARI